jgi:aminopeptidase 2
MVRPFAKSYYTNESHSIIEVAINMFGAFQNGDDSAIHPNIRNAVFAMVLKQNNGKEKEAYKVLLELSQNTKRPEEARDALIGLGNIRESAIMQSLLELLLTDDIKVQDVSSFGSKVNDFDC